MKLRSTRNCRMASLALASFGVLFAGCGDGSPAAPAEPETDTTTTQAAVKSALGGVETDVEQMRFELFACPSATHPDGNGDGIPDGITASQTMVSPLGPGFLPEGLPRFEDKPLDASARGSKHRYSDGLFLVTPEICHVVRSTPLQKSGAVSKDCYAAAKTVGGVPAGRTKEFVMINQCKGSPKAGIDAVAALNNPPELIGLTFARNGEPGTKFTCQDEVVRVCATVLEPDNDPLDFSLVEVDGAGNPVASGLKIAQVPGFPEDKKNGVALNCWDVVGKKPGSHDLKVVAKDLIWDSSATPPVLIPVEQFIATRQHEMYKSRAELMFPVHIVPCDCQTGVDIVFTMDTSGSMFDDAKALCNNISMVESNLKIAGINAKSHLLGITETGDKMLFPCLTDSVANLVGNVVPGDAGTCGQSLNQSESWGQATSVVAKGFPWTPGFQRVVVPISDEGACNGDPCLDPGKDRDSIDNAVKLAKSEKVIVSPISASGSSSCVTGLAYDLAAGTGGTAFISTDPSLDLAKGIETLVKNACKVP